MLAGWGLSYEERQWNRADSCKGATWLLMLTSIFTHAITLFLSYNHNCSNSLHNLGVSCFWSWSLNKTTWKHKSYSLVKTLVCVILHLYLGGGGGHWVTCWILLLRLLLYLLYQRIDIDKMVGIWQVTETLESSATATLTELLPISCYSRICPALWFSVLVSYGGSTAITKLHIHSTSAQESSFMPNQSL